MEVVNLSLPATNRFATEYIAQTPEIQAFFHYRYNEKLEYERRYDELISRSFMRQELAAHIEQYMSKYPSSDMIQASLEKLRQENSSVIIGGQQAGILTGPLYSIHKIISIIQLAKEKEKDLHIPVIPVFWIAGEDHDYPEVNHVFIENDKKLEKRVYPEKIHDKRMVSDIKLNRDQCLTWVEDVIQSLGETEYTKDLLSMMEISIQKSDTFVDFFAHLIMNLFKDTGLLIVDSGDKNLRRLEKEFFAKQIDSCEEITNAVLRQQMELTKDGYSKTIDMSSLAANLFYYDEENYERVLLEYDGKFSGKDGYFQFSKQNLLELAKEFPEKLSNNVVTRPMMQEWLFPTLAFIAGPGEIAYWAELKQAFEQFGLKMPPIVPRLNITFLDRTVESDMKELNLSLEEVLISGSNKKKDEFLHSIRDKQLTELFVKSKQDLLKNYEELEEHLRVNDKGLVPLLKKNEGLLLKQLEFMEIKLEQAQQLKYETVISKYTRIENALRPLESPQERVLNVLFYLNQYGLNFANNLLDCTYTFDGTHKLIKI
ncbi:bacillithiol biosynthesis cysteine-adding enzyme BshC [Cytobacillus depressus]|uniref:Putative cysteine ligase BshC n=1 Tax=Cytobacillus depressus TaxID=1602942 RepID=A0A6L3V9Z6_9BACI|nr:bacillithiol biosynthesis cysteine-adding enzyme BshC [Cytobacillus depressus]KAB2337409.1 bacillithiol biosynthesis cysteine-adding enzyme BshC [Cytobacillus depressus]